MADYSFAIFRHNYLFWVVVAACGCTRHAEDQTNCSKKNKHETTVTLNFTTH